jgi:hypothetical protein
MRGCAWWRETRDTRRVQRDKVVSGSSPLWDRDALHEGMPEMCGQQDTAGGVCTTKELHALLLEPRMHSDAGMHADVCGELVEETRASMTSTNDARLRCSWYATDMPFTPVTSHIASMACSAASTAAALPYSAMWWLKALLLKPEKNSQQQAWLPASLRPS